MIIDRNKDSNTGFTIACANNSIETVKILIENKVNIEHQNKDRNTGFKYACANNSVEIIELLSKTDPDINHNTKST